ncbi:MAG TPA: GNAT family N-acetyltransferase [Chloroflexota bacterium]|nr:GNAT family N-acetyltransferase [Chloroflexota bacterium]
MPEAAEAHGQTNSVLKDGLHPGILVRPATVEDLPRLTQLLFQLSQMGEQPETGPREAAAVEPALRAVMADDRSSCIVIEAADQVHGTLTFYILPNLSFGGQPIAMIENVVVDEESRGRGFGRLLMEHAEREIREAGCVEILLASNKRRLVAHRFYEGLGYQATHEGFTKFL